jgi:hypothetical protein
MWVGLISTAVLAGGALTFGTLAHVSDQELGHELARIPADRGRVADASSDLERNAALCDVFTGGALVAAAISLYFALSTSHAEQAPTASPERKALRINAAGGVPALVQEF